MLMIRMSRVGKKKYPTYRILIQEKSKDPWGKALEILGNYNPHTKEFACKEDRIKYWLSVGAQMSATVNNLLIRNKVIEGKKMKAAKLNKKKKGDQEENKEESKEEKKEETTTAKPTEEAKEEKTETPQEKPVEENKEEKKEEKRKETSSDK